MDAVAWNYLLQARLPEKYSKDIYDNSKKNETKKVPHKFCWWKQLWTDFITAKCFIPKAF